MEFLLDSYFAKIKRNFCHLGALKERASPKRLKMRSGAYYRVKVIYRNSSTLYPESSFPFASGRETSDPGKTRFVIQKQRTSGWIAHPLQRDAWFNLKRSCFTSTRIRLFSKPNKIEAVTELWSVARFCPACATRNEDSRRKLVTHESKPNAHAHCVILQQTDSLPESDSSKPDALSAELEAQVK